ncbi:MAG: hypothetical protein WDA53_10305 [Bacillota bacterium]
MKAFLESLRDRLQELWKKITLQLNSLKSPKLPLANQRDLMMIAEAKRAWQDSIRFFQEVTEPALIDFAIYHMEAEEKRMVHLIRQMGQKYPEGIWRLEGSMEG